jgi:hypothetical protein
MARDQPFLPVKLRFILQIEPPKTKLRLLTRLAAKIVPAVVYEPTRMNLLATIWTEFFHFAINGVFVLDFCAPSSVPFFLRQSVHMHTEGGYRPNE